MRNDATDWADRLYESLPSVYRTSDLELGRQRSPGQDDAAARERAPLHALLGAMSEQVAAVRENLDALWDDFFLETAEDWAIPYLGALLGANLAANPVGIDNRVYLASLVEWRRRKGTPTVLAELGRAITGRPADFVEFFRLLGWTQNVNAVDPARVVTADVTDAYTLSRLDRSDDVLAHSVQVSRGGTYQAKSVGFFVAPLQTFRRRGVTPAGAGADAYRFDPLQRSLPLFAAATATTITTAQLRHDPARFADDVVVRQHGVPLAAVPREASAESPSSAPFDFGGDPPHLHPTEGLLLLGVSPAAPVVITALWQSGGTSTTIGTLTVPENAFAVATAPETDGVLVLRLESATAVRFPASVLAVRAAGTPRAQPTPWSRYANAVLAYLPDVFLWPGEPVELAVAADGATRSGGEVVRAAAGQVWPSANLHRPSADPAQLRLGLHRRAGLRAVDPDLLENAPSLVVEGLLLRETPVLLGTLAAGATPYTPSEDAVRDRISFASPSLFALRLSSDTAVVCPQCELVVTDRSGASLLVYVPETPLAAGGESWLVVAGDGSTYLLPPPPPVSPAPGVLPANADLARASAGQVLPIVGTVPLRQRLLVAGTPASGELGIDPEDGSFAFAAGDPILTAPPASRDLTVDYVEAFAGPVGARGPVPTGGLATTRAVASSGDTIADVPFWRIHTTLADALDHAVDGDVIEIADGATYAEPLPADVRGTLAIRARHGACLVGDVNVTGTGAFSLAGLLVHGATTVGAALERVSFAACTLERLTLAGGNGVLRCTVDRCTTGTVTGADGLASLAITDSVVGNVALAQTTALSVLRTTVLGWLRAGTLTGRDALLRGRAKVADRDAGSLSYSRFARGSRLPRRVEHCVPRPDDPAAERAQPRFVSLRTGSAGYAQLSPASSQLVLTASELDDQVGAFAAVRPGTRLANLLAQLDEFLPAGLTPSIIGGETT